MLLVGALIIAWAAWMFGTSYEFGKCIEQRKAYDAYKALHEKPFFIIKLFVRLRLNSVCTFHSLNAYSGVVTAMAGIVVAGFTGTLWWSTEKLWSAGEDQRGLIQEQAAISKRQVEISERSLTISEWPYLFMQKQHFITPWSNTPVFGFTRAEYVIEIHGDSPAIIRQISENMFFEEHLPTATSENSKSWLVVDQIYKPGETWSSSVQCNRHITDSELCSPKRYFFLTLVIIYDDLFGHQHEMACAYRTVASGGSGFICGGAEYNYHRIRDLKEHI